MGLSDNLEVGTAEIVADAEKGLVGKFGGGIGQAVAEIQARRVASLAKTPVCIDGKSGVLLGKGDDD